MYSMLISSTGLLSPFLKDQAGVGSIPPYEAHAVPDYMGRSIQPLKYRLLEQCFALHHSIRELSLRTWLAVGSEVPLGPGWWENLITKAVGKV